MSSTRTNRRTPVALLLACAAGCTPYHLSDEVPPVAIAGPDRTLPGPSAEVTLDGSASYDPDGQIVRYEWRYTGKPPGYQAPSGVDDEEDGGVSASPGMDVPDLLKPLPSFCIPPDPDEEVLIPARYCRIMSWPGDPKRSTLTLETGGYRFTLWVQDDDGLVSADTVNIVVEP
jgi:hypothetical protein